MKVLKRLKRPSKQTHYVAPKKIVMTSSQVMIVKKLGLSLEDYAKAYFDNFCSYKQRYC